MMPKNRLQVLAPLLLLAAPSLSRAQPPDVPNAISGPQTAQPRDLPLLPIKLEDWLAQNGGLSRLKLKLDNATAQEVADEVRKQTGVEVVPSDDLQGAEDKAPRFSVEATGQAFWEAVANWNRPATPAAPRLYLQRDWQNNNRWRMVTWGGPEKGRSLQLGPVWMVASSLSVSHSRSQSLDSEQDPQANPKAEAPLESDSMYIQSSMQIDPRLRPLILGLIPQIDGVTDDRNRAIALSDNHQNPWIEDSNYLSFSLQAPARDARRLRSLRGTLRLAVLTRRDRWEIDLKTSPSAEKTFKSQEAEVKVRMQGVAPRLNGWSLSLHLERKEAGPKRVFKAQGRENGSEAQLGSYNDTTRAVQVLNAEGQPLGTNGSNSRSGEENGTRTLDIVISIENTGQAQDAEKRTPAKIIIDVPLEWREIDIPFELRDLPLPPAARE